MTTKTLTLSALFLIFFAARGVMAQDDETQRLIDGRDEVVVAAQSQARGPSSGWDASLEGLVFFDTDGEGLDVGTLRSRLRLTRTEVIDRRSLLFVGVDWEHSFYDVDGLAALLPGANGDDLDHLDRVGVSVGFAQRLTDEWGWFIQLRGGFSGDLQANFSGGLRGGGIAGAEWRPNSDLTLRFGVGAFTRIEESALVIPAITAQWQFAPDWNLDLGFPQTKLTWQATDEFSLGLAARFDFRDYRLDGSGPLDDAVLRDDAIRLELGAEWSPNPGLRVGLGIGAPIWREISFDDANGNELLEADLDVAPTLRFEVGLRF